MTRSFTLALAALGLSTLGAAAADLPVRVPAAVPAAAPVVVNWTGFYVGANVGYTWGQADARYTGNPAFVGGPVAVGLAPAGFALDTSGVIGGGQLGYNFQFGQWVLGAEADFQAIGQRNNGVTFFGAVGPAGLTSSASASVDWLATVRGRAGFAFDNFLLYGTGGVAFGDVNASGAIVGSGLLGGTAWGGSYSETRVGWTAGAGVEYAFSPNISFKLEYLYYDLGAVDVSVAPANGFTAATGIAAFQRHEFDGHIVRAGVNFRF
jgi:outer membrane immunogenic protein